MLPRRLPIFTDDADRCKRYRIYASARTAAKVAAMRSGAPEQDAVAGRLRSGQYVALIRGKGWIAAHTTKPEDHHEPL
jgi:hypothetical protein